MKSKETRERTKWFHEYWLNSRLYIRTNQKWSNNKGVFLFKRIGHICICLHFRSYPSSMGVIETLQSRIAKHSSKSQEMRYFLSCTRIAISTRENVAFFFKKVNENWIIVIKWKCIFLPKNFPFQKKIIFTELCYNKNKFKKN